MVIEAGVVAGYVIGWALRKARRAGGQLDAEADAVLNASLDRLHEVVEKKLGGHPVLAELVEEATSAEDGGDQVSELTRQQLELALRAAARKDEMFGRSVTELTSRLRDAEKAAGQPLFESRGATVFTGDAHAKASGSGIAFGQISGSVNISREPARPREPGRPSH